MSIKASSRPMTQKMDVREQGQQARHGDDQDHGPHDHEDLRLPRPGDETWQMMRGRWVKGCSHSSFLSLRVAIQRRRSGS
jgi:hypothetical protein